MITIVSKFYKSFPASDNYAVWCGLTRTVNCKHIQIRTHCYITWLYTIAYQI